VIPAHYKRQHRGRRRAMQKRFHNERALKADTCCTNYTLCCLNLQIPRPEDYDQNNVAYVLPPGANAIKTAPMGRAASAGGCCCGTLVPDYADRTRMYPQFCPKRQRMKTPFWERHVTVTPPTNPDSVPALAPSLTDFGWCKRQDTSVPVPSAPHGDYTEDQQMAACVLQRAQRGHGTRERAEKRAQKRAERRENRRAKKAAERTADEELLQNFLQVGGCPQQRAQVAAAVEARVNQLRQEPKRKPDGDCLNTGDVLSYLVEDQ